MEDVKEILNDLKKDIKEAVVPEVVEQVKSSLEAERKDIFGGAKNTKADIKDKKEATAEYISAVYRNDFATVKALSDGTSTEGSELVPEYFASEIIRLAPQYGVFRQNARVYPVNGLTTHLPTAGSVTAYRVSEKGAITTSQPTTGQITLTMQKLATMIPMSNELLKDANVGVVDLLTRLSAEALAKKEDEWGFNGLASGEGILQNASVPVQALGTGDTSYDDVNAKDLLDLLSQLDESAVPGAKWFMSFSVFNALRGLKDTNGQYIVQQPAGGMPATIWNLPVVLARVLPKTTDSSQTGTKFLAVGDMNYAILGDRREYSMEISREATITDTDGTTAINLFAQDMSAVRVIERIDIQLAEAGNAFAVLKTAAA